MANSKAINELSRSREIEQKSAKSIKTPTVDFETDARSFPNLYGPNKKQNVEDKKAFNRILTVEIDSGKDLGDDKVAKANVDFQFNGNMINIKPDVQKALIAQSEALGKDKGLNQIASKYIQDTEYKSGTANKSGAIVDYDVINDKGTLKARASIDVYEFAKVLDKNGRVPMTITATTSQSGVGAMNVAALSENVIQAVATDQVLTGMRSGKGSTPAITNEDVIRATEVYNDEFNKFMLKYAREDHGKTVSKDGTEIPYTEFPSFESVGLAVVEVDGATVITELPSATDEQLSARKEALRNASNAFSKELTQVAFNDPTLSQQTQFILQNMKVDMYLTKPIQGMEMKVVQPEFGYVVSAYPDNIVKAYDYYHHDRDAVGQTYMSNREFAGEIHNYERAADAYEGSKAMDAYEMADRIAEAVKADYKEYPKGYGKESEGHSGL